MRIGTGDSSHNLFGIKADSRWQGDKVMVSTLEYRDGVALNTRRNFRAYDRSNRGFLRLRRVRAAQSALPAGPGAGDRSKAYFSPCRRPDIDRPAYAKRFSASSTRRVDAACGTHLQRRAPPSELKDGGVKQQWQASSISASIALNAFKRQMERPGTTSPTSIPRATAARLCSWMPARRQIAARGYIGIRRRRGVDPTQLRQLPGHAVRDYTASYEVCSLPATRDRSTTWSPIPGGYRRHAAAVLCRVNDVADDPTSIRRAR